MEGGEYVFLLISRHVLVWEASTPPTMPGIALYAQSGHTFPRSQFLVVARVYHSYCSLISTVVFLSRHSTLLLDRQLLSFAQIICMFVQQSQQQRHQLDHGLHISHASLATRTAELVGFSAGIAHTPSLVKTVHRSCKYIGI